MRNQARTRISLSLFLFWLDSFFFDVIFFNLSVIYILLSFLFSFFFQFVVTHYIHFIIVVDIDHLSLLYYVQLGRRLCRTIIRMLHLISRIFPSITFWGKNTWQLMDIKWVFTYCIDTRIFTYLVEIVLQISFGVL